MAKNLLKGAAQVPEEWPQLIPLDAPILPRLEPSLLPSWAGSFARALSESTETPPELAVGMVLVSCATAAARRLRVQLSTDHIEPCNLWVVVALPSGNRKSAVQRAATDPLMAWEREKAASLEAEITRLTSERRTLEARVKEVRHRAAKEKDPRKAEQFTEEAAQIDANLPEIPAIPRLWTSDSTPERLGSLLAENDECMAWLSSEGGVFDLLQGRYSNGIPNLDLVLKGHSGDSERVDRGSRPQVFLGSPCLSIGLSPQPDVLRGLAGRPGFRGRGLLGRFLYLLPPSPLGYRTLQTEPIPLPTAENYAAGVASMLNWETAPGDPGKEQRHLLQLHPEAEHIWRSYGHLIERQMRPGGELEQFTDWGGKAPGAAARLAGVFHGMRYAMERPWEYLISEETMANAVEMMDVIMKHSLAALDMMGADPSIAAARQVWDWIERRRLTGFKLREAFNALRTTFPRVQNLRAALDALEERGYVMVLEPPKDGPGRPPSPIVRVRPGLTAKWE